MSQKKESISSFPDLKGVENSVVCLLAVNIDYCRRTELINSLRKFDKYEINNSTCNSTDIKVEIDNLIREGVIVEDNNGLCCADEVRKTALAETLANDCFIDMALLLQDNTPAREESGNTIFSSFYQGLRDLQIAIFGNSSIENISRTLLDIYQQFPTESRDTPPLFFLLDNPFSPELLQYLTPFNRILLLGTMVTQAEETLTPAEHIFDYWYSLYLEGEFEIPVTELLSALLIRGRFQEMYSIIEDNRSNEKMLPLPYRELYRGSLAFLEDRNSEAIEYLEKGLAALDSNSADIISFPEGYAGLFFLLALLKDGSYRRLKQGLSYLDIIEEKENFNYYSCYRNLRVVFYDQPGLQAEHGSFISRDMIRSSLNPKQQNRHNSLLEEFFFILTLWWIDQKEAQNSTDRLQIIQKKASKSNYLWLAAESANLLASFDWTRGEAKDYARSTHEKIGSASIINIVQEVPHWERTLNALLNITPPDKKGKERKKRIKRLVWWFRYHDHDKSCSLQPRLQTLTRNDRWSKGRPLRLKQLYTEALSLKGLSEQDLKVCSTISEIPESERLKDHYGPRSRYRFNYEYTLPALIGHPLIFLEDCPDVRIDLVAGEPEVRVRRNGKGIDVRIEPNPVSIPESGIQIIRDNSTRFRVIRCNEAQQHLQKIIGSGVTFPEEKVNLIQEVLTRISDVVTIQSDLGSIGGQVREVETDSRPHIQLIPYHKGLKLEILVKPVAGASSWFRPGKDALNVMAEVNNVRVQARRDLEKENLLTELLIDSCPTLARKCKDQADEIVVEDPEECLNILQELKESEEKVVLEWPEGEKFRLRKNITDSDLSLHIRKDRNWFKASGFLEIDENSSMELSELFDRFDRSKGRFLPLDDGSFLALTHEFRNRLADLKAYSGKSGKEIKLHPLTAPAVNDLTSEVGALTCDVSWEKHINEFENPAEPEIPEGLKADLRDYQVEGVKWLIQLSQWGIGACLADDMGLGKTAQALAAVLVRADKGPTLVVAPLSVINNWKDEAERFAPALNIKIFGRGDRQQLLDHLQSFDLVLVSYGLLQVEVERLGKVRWQTLILDEAQAIKNRMTKISRAAMALEAEFKLITTGTPIENHPGEMWTLFNFINPGLLGSYKHFHETYTIPIERDHDKAASERLRKLIKPFILRRLKNEVLQELPPRTDVTLEVEMSKQEAALYSGQRRRALQYLKNGSKENRKFRILAEITRLRRLCCNPSLIWPESDIPGSKLKVFGDILSNLLDNNHNVLVFSQFVDHLTIIRQYLQDLDIEYQYLDGSTPAHQREKSIKNFQKGQGRVFLISLKAGGFGLNLSAADYVIHMDPWWNPAVEDQASDRAHRLGQQRPVTVYRLVMKNSIEEQIVELHTQKRDLADSLLEGSNIAGRMSSEQLLDLLKE
ncbi:MAG: DEAD/DEAH box helicase [Desulfurivibrionaceae bacterium]